MWPAHFAGGGHREVRPDKVHCRYLMSMAGIFIELVGSALDEAQLKRNGKLTFVLKNFATVLCKM